MANGRVSLSLASQAEWNEFERAARAIGRALDGTLGERSDGIEVRLWELEVDGASFYVAWDVWQGLSLEPRDDRASEAIPGLKNRLQQLRV
ncbi:MAG: DUF3630 family protein [Myxococcota bacterium]